MSNDSKSFRIFLAHRDEGARASLRETLTNLTHKLIGESRSCKETIVECALNPPDLIISGTRFPDGDGIETLIKVSKRKPVPAIIVTSEEEIETVEHALDDHVMAYLIDPVKDTDLKPTIFVVKRRFDQMEELKSEVETLKEALVNRKKLDRAKGLLMQRKNISEEEAYLEIRDLAKKSRMKLGKIAEVVIETYALDLKN